MYVNTTQPLVDKSNGDIKAKLYRPVTFLDITQANDKLWHEGYNNNNLSQEYTKC